MSVVRLCVCSITWSHCPVWAAILSLSLPLLPALSTAPSIIVLQCHSLKNGEEVEGGRGANERGKKRQDEYVAKLDALTATEDRETHKCVQGSTMRTEEKVAFLYFIASFNQATISFGSEARAKDKCRRGPGEEHRRQYNNY